MTRHPFLWSHEFGVERLHQISGMIFCREIASQEFVLPHERWNPFQMLWRNRAFRDEETIPQGREEVLILYRQVMQQVAEAYPGYDQHEVIDGARLGERVVVMTSQSYPLALNLTYRLLEALYPDSALNALGLRWQDYIGQFSVPELALLNRKMIRAPLTAADHALFAAAGQGDQESIDVAIHAGAQLHCFDDHGNTPLGQLISAWADHFYRDAGRKESPQQALLTNTARWQQALQALLTAGAHPDVADFEELSPLQHALLNLLLPAIPMLLKAGGNIALHSSFDDWAGIFHSFSWFDLYFEGYHQNDMSARLINACLLLRYPHPAVGKSAYAVDESARTVCAEAREWLAGYQTDCPIQQRFIEDMAAIPLLPRP